MPDSIITKAAIANALKEACKEKKFDKISIADITARCGLNRQTFYYHFQDKYELLSWIYYHENFAKITENITFDDWNEKLLEMLKIMNDDKIFYINTVKEQQRTFESYLFEMSKTLFRAAIDKLDESHKLGDEECEFDAEFYAYGICGVILNWTEKGMKSSPEALAKRVKNLVDNTKHIGYIRVLGSLAD